MSLLSGTSCYLVGPVENDEKHGKDWRQTVGAELVKMGVKVYNPLDRPQWMASISMYIPPVVTRSEVLRRAAENNNAMWDVAQMVVRDVCIRYVATCDFIFCYLSDTKTYGTIEELALAARLGKPIVCVYKECPSLWVYAMLDKKYVYKDIDSALGFLRSVNDGKVHELDAIDWIFIGGQGDAYKTLRNRYNQL